MRIEFPGFVDLQVNGFAGVDFNTPGATPADIGRALAAMRAGGVTRCLPTLITSSWERFRECVRAVIDADDPAVAGIHLEGPYISPADGPRGAHPKPHCCSASRDDFDRRQEAAGGRIVLVTLAPEVPGALALIAHLASAGVRVAIGHTDASPGQIRDAVAAGATLSTHLGNGCAAMLPRHPNVIWEQLAADALSASVIADGHHLPPAVVKAIARVKGPARTILVTDAMAAAGCPAGHYRIGDVDVEVGGDRRVSLRGTPFLAGSALTMADAVANMVRFAGVPLTDALAMASTVPAEYVGISPAGRVAAEWDAERAELRIVEVSET